MGLGGNFAVQRHLDGAKHRLLIMLENERQDLHHLSIPADALQQVMFPSATTINAFLEPQYSVF